MIQIPVKQAITEFDTLLKAAALGKEAIIIDSDGSVYKLIALSRISQPLFGSARGQVIIGPDFDESIEGFEEY
ncbi:MAG: hypothetical protein JXA42_18360 [Anaerolineales bacterium]|nr:hypothetical protein [Anaerolineales bacterium]